MSVSGHCTMPAQTARQTRCISVEGADRKPLFHPFWDWRQASTEHDPSTLMADVRYAISPVTRWARIADNTRASGTKMPSVNRRTYVL